MVKVNHGFLCVLAAIIGLSVACVKEEPAVEEERYVRVVVRETNGDRLYSRAVLLYNRAEYPNGIVEGMEQTNWTGAHGIAEEALWKYVAVRSTNAKPMAYLLLGELQRRQNRHCESIEFYAESIQRGPTRYICHHASVNLAYAAMRCGGTNVEVGRLALLEAMRRHPSLRTNRDLTGCLAHVYRYKAFTAYEKTDYAEAVVQYKKALKLRPLWPDFANDLAVTYLRLADIALEEGCGKVAMDYVNRADLLVNRSEFLQYQWPKLEETRACIRNMR